MNQSWTPRALKQDWRDYLTDEERAAVADAEIVASGAKAVLAKVSATLGPIRNRALKRRHYAETLKGQS